MKRILEAMMLAFGTIFGLKGDVDAHWSESPAQLQQVIEETAEDPGGDPPR